MLFNLQNTFTSLLIVGLFVLSTSCGNLQEKDISIPPTTENESVVKKNQPKPEKKPSKCDLDFDIPVTISSDNFEYVHETKQEVYSVLNAQLDLSSKNFSKLPTPILSANCIEELDLSQNALTAVPAQLLNNPHLKKLDLSNNKITTIPKLSVATSIESLNLSGNQIKTIPAHIADYQSLKFLYLEDMSTLTDIHEDIKKLPNLKHIVIKKTPLGKSYVKVRKLTKLLPDTQIFWFSKE